MNLISVEPKIPDLAANHPLTDIVVQLDKGRKEFRNSQVHSISNRIPSWGFKVPQDKQLRGFGDDVCGKLLCPSTQDWGNPTCVHNDLLQVITELILRSHAELANKFGCSKFLSPPMTFRSSYGRVSELTHRI